MAQAIHLGVVTEVLGQIRQAEMTPLLSRLYNSPGNGSELCDTLMKYLYKGMSQGSGQTGEQGKRNVTPQATGGFSQSGGRNFGGDAGGGGGMSVLLSWLEKVRLRGMIRVRRGVVR